MNMDRLKAFANQYAESVREHPAPCKHGHPDCAAAPGGGCLIEVLSIAGLNDQGEEGLWKQFCSLVEEGC